MRTIAIVLCDNDFGNTFIPLLETIKRVIEHRGIDKVTPVDIDFIIRQNVMAHYFAFQFHFGVQEHRGTTESYLKRIKVLFDEDAEKHITENDHDRGSWYLELHSGRVFSY
jgi:hypothetical protein